MTEPVDVNDLLKRIEALEALLGYPRKTGLEEKKKPWNPPWNVLPLGRRSVCDRCGIDFSGVTGYVCPSANCPVQPPITC